MHLQADQEVANLQLPAHKFLTETPSVIFRRYDECSNYNYTEHRKSIFPISPVQIDALEKKWLLSGSTCDLDMLKKLSQKDYQLINRKDYFTGFAAIHWAAKRGRVDVASWLFEQNADINIRTNGGYSPLHIATIHNKDTFVKTLIKEFHADINVRDYSGRKARHYMSHDMPVAVHRALSETPSILEGNINPYEDRLVVPTMSYVRASSLPLSNSMPSIADEQGSPTEVAKKKKKRGLALSDSFKVNHRLFNVVRREPKERRSSETTHRWRKSLSVPDISQISAPVSIRFDQEF